jgi:hypothetical protein
MRLRVALKEGNSGLTKIFSRKDRFGSGDNMNYFVDLSRMSLDELLSLRIAADEGLFAVDGSNLDLLSEHINFRLAAVEKLEKLLNKAS